MGWSMNQVALNKHQHVIADLLYKRELRVNIQVACSSRTMEKRCNMAAEEENEEASLCEVLAPTW